MTKDGFGVNLADLQRAEQGVHEAVGELNAIGGGAARSAGAGQDGRGLSELESDVDSDTVGHEQLAAALSTFLDKWDWELKTLVKDGNQAADALADTRSTYQKAEQGAMEAMQKVVQVVGGNPMQD